MMMMMVIVLVVYVFIIMVGIIFMGKSQIWGFGSWVGYYVWACVHWRGPGEWVLVTLVNVSKMYWDDLMDIAWVLGRYVYDGT